MPPPRPRVHPGFAIAILLIGGPALGAFAGAELESTWLGAAVGTVLSLLLARALWARFRPLKEQPFIALGDEHLTFSLVDRVDRVPIDELLEVDAGDGTSHLAIATARRVYAYHARAFVDPNGVALLSRSLLDRIASRPDGARRLADMERRRALAHAALRRKPLATWILAGTIVVFYALEYALGALDDAPLTAMLAMLRLGASNSTLIEGGEWFRLITANFLHGNLLHIYMNGMALLYLGALLERLLGPSRLLVIYILSALGGAAASALFSSAFYAVGASTAVFGLLGALGAMQLRFGHQLPMDFRRSQRWWLIIIVVNGALPLLFPVIGLAAHVGGAIVGFLITLAIVAPHRELEVGRPAGVPIRISAGALAALTVAAFAWCAARAVDASAGERALSSIIAATDEPFGLNDLAWRIATDPEASDRDLSIATSLAERAVELDDRVELLDTLATVRYRTGALDAAVALERRVVALDDDGQFASQLARFLGARVARDGAIGPAHDVSIRWEHDRLVASAPPSLGSIEVLILSGPPSRPAAILGLTFEGEATFALAAAPVRPLTVALVDPRPGLEAKVTLFAPSHPEIAPLP